MKMVDENGAMDVDQGIMARIHVVVIVYYKVSEK